MQRRRDTAAQHGHRPRKERTGMNGNYGLAKIENGWQVISRTRFNQQDWNDDDGLKGILANSLRLGVISLTSGKAEFTADPDVEIGSVEVLEEVKRLMTAVEEGESVSIFSPQQNPLVGFTLNDFKYAAEAIAAADDDATVDEILGENDDDMGRFESKQSVGTLPPFAFTDTSLVIDTKKGSATFAAGTHRV
jgi:hypothetical protein